MNIEDIKVGHYYHYPDTPNPLDQIFLIDEIIAEQNIIKYHYTSCYGDSNCEWRGGSNNLSYWAEQFHGEYDVTGILWCPVTFAPPPERRNFWGWIRLDGYDIIE
jgi:hypothetical protein